MTSAFGRISENLLFSLLIAVFTGWTVVSVAADPAASSASCAITHVFTHTGNS
jgi:hypothetical protein